MQRPAFITSPLPHLKRTRPFRAAGGNALTNRARLGTLPLGNDAHHTACRYRLARRHVAEHRPAGVVHAFRHPCLCQLLRAHICDVDLPVMPHETVRHHAEEMPTSDASQDPARLRSSLSRRRFVVSGLFRCVSRRRCVGDHQAGCRVTEAARFLVLKGEPSAR
jgi:hypothetical protein